MGFSKSSFATPCNVGGGGEGRGRRGEGAEADANGERDEKSKNIGGDENEMTGAGRKGEERGRGVENREGVERQECR